MSRLRCLGSGGHSVSPPLPELREQKALQEKTLDLRPQLLLFSHSLCPLIPQEDKAGLITSYTNLREGAVSGRPLLLGGAQAGPGTGPRDSISQPCTGRRLQSAVREGPATSYDESDESVTISPSVNR